MIPFAGKLRAPYLDPFHRQVCCFLGTWVRDVIRRLPGLSEPSDYYRLLVVQVGSDKVDERSLMAVKKNFRALGQQIERTRAQVVFSSNPLVAGRKMLKGTGELI